MNVILGAYFKGIFLPYMKLCTKVMDVNEIEI